MKTTTSPLPALRTGAPTPGAQARALVRWAVEQRSNAMRYGWSRLPHPTMVAQVNRLELWLRTNIHPSPETLKRMWAELGTTIRYVMPGTAAGKKKLHELETLIHCL